MRESPFVARRHYWIEDTARPMQGIELSEQKAPPKHTAIRVTFVTPPKRDEHGSIPQRASLISYSDAK